MKYLSSLFIGSVILYSIVSCNRSEERLSFSGTPTVTQVESPKDAATLLKELEDLTDLALSGRMIMLTGADLVQLQEKVLKNEEIEPDKLLQAKAIVYRFHKTVYVKDGVVRSRAKKGEEIGIREDVFKLYCDNLRELTRGIEEIRKTRDYTDEQIEKDMKVELVGMVQ